MAARAIEMRARRVRVNSLRQDIVDLEKRAGLRSPPSPPEEGCPDYNSHPLPSNKADEKGPVPTTRKPGAIRPVGFGQGSPGGLAEEMVLRDAERGVRLMPLPGNRKGRGDDDCSSDGTSGAVGGAGGRGVSVGRLWRWVRGL